MTTLGTLKQGERLPRASMTPHGIVESVSWIESHTRKWWHPGATEDGVTALAKHVLKNAVLFDFSQIGDVKLNELMSEEHIRWTTNLINDDMFILPYNSVVVKAPDGGMTYLFAKQPDATKGALAGMNVAYLKEDAHTPPYMCFPDLCIMDLDIAPAENEKQDAATCHYRHYQLHVDLNYPGSNLTEEFVTDRAIMVCHDIFMACAMMTLLERKGMTTRRLEPAPIKLNKNRATKGRPPIRDAHVVKLNLDALREDRESGGQGGTHASPIPHYRRAHLRHYQSGKVAKIPRLMINFDEHETDEVMRPIYEARMRKLDQTSPIET